MYTLPTNGIAVRVLLFLDTMSFPASYSPLQDSLQICENLDPPTKCYLLCRSLSWNVLYTFQALESESRYDRAVVCSPHLKSVVGPVSSECKLCFSLHGWDVTSHQFIQAILPDSRFASRFINFRYRFYSRPAVKPYWNHLSLLLLFPALCPRSPCCRLP